MGVLLIKLHIKYFVMKFRLTDSELDKLGSVFLDILLKELSDEDIEQIIRLGEVRYAYPRPETLGFTEEEAEMYKMEWRYLEKEVNKLTLEIINDLDWLTETLVYDAIQTLAEFPRVR